MTFSLLFSKIGLEHLPFSSFLNSDELDQLFQRNGLEKEQNLIDRRLQVNRSRQLKMYRIWLQCKYVRKNIE